MNIIVLIGGIILTLIVITSMIVYFNRDPAPGLIPTQKAGQPCSAGIVGCIAPALCDNTGICRLADFSDCTSNSECLSGVCAGGKVCLSVNDFGTDLFNAPDPDLGCVGFDLELDSTGTICLVKPGATCTRSEECVSQICGDNGTCLSFARIGEACNGLCDYPLVCSGSSKGSYCQQSRYKTGDPGSDCSISKYCISTSSCGQDGICSFTTPTQYLLDPCAVNGDCLLGTCNGYCSWVRGNGFNQPAGSPCSMSCSSGTCSISTSILKFNLNSFSSVSSIQIQNPKVFEMFPNGTFLVSDLVNISINGIVKPITDTKDLIDIKINPNGVIYYFYRSSFNIISYTTDFSIYTQVKNGSTAITFSDPVQFRVGNNITVLTKEQIWVSYQSYFKPFSTFLDGNPLAIFQLVPNTVAILSREAIDEQSYLVLQTMTGNISGDTLGQISQVFRVPVTIDQNQMIHAGYTVYQGSQKLIVSYIDSSTNKREILLLIDNQQTFLPGDFNNTLVNLSQNQIYILSDKNCR